MVNVAVQSADRLRWSLNCSHATRMNSDSQKYFSRREFVKSSAAIFSATLLAPNLFAAQPAESSLGKKRNIKKAMMLPTVPGRGSVTEKFRMIKAAGFDGVEPRGSMNRDEILKARDETGLKIPSVCCLTHWAKPLSDPNPSVRAQGLEGLKTALHDAKVYGASSVLLVPAVVNEHVSYKDAYERSQIEIRKVIPLAEELSVKIAIENVWNKFLLSPLEAARYVDEFNSPAIGWHFDIGNVLAFGWPEHWIPVLGKRIQKLHFKEYSRKKQLTEGMLKGFEVDYLEGDNDWPAIMKALDDIGYDGWAIAEPPYHPPGIAPAERLKQIVEKMDKILAL
jgi:L-ribulose-5-phosphate 3-epimerase